MARGGSGLNIKKKYENCSISKAIVISNVDISDVDLRKIDCNIREYVK